MNFFEEEQSVVVEKTPLLWVEKYRPKTFDEYIGNEAFKEKLKKILATGDLQHLMLHGIKSGTGKTSAAKLIANTIDCDCLYLNCSDTNGIDDVRLKIKTFAATIGFKSVKVIILDESDFLSIPAQSALRGVIEQFEATTRFIFTCNYIDKIIPAILSRCQVFEICPPFKRDVALRLKHILEVENVSYTLDDLKYIVETYYPDIRKVIGFSQQNVIDNVLKITKENVVDLDFKSKLVNILKAKEKTAFKDIRQLIADSDIKHFDVLYQYLYEKTAEISSNEVVAIITIAEYMYQSSLVVDKEITFMACVAKLISES